jgi:hypothetical protein
MVVRFITQPLLSLANIIVTIAEVLWETFTAVVNALTAAPEDIDQWAQGTEITNDMIIVMLWILGSVDNALATYHMVPAVYMMVGAMGLMAFKKWSERWESIIPI